MQHSHYPVTFGETEMNDRIVESGGAKEYISFAILESWWTSITLHEQHSPLHDLMGVQLERLVHDNTYKVWAFKNWYFFHCWDIKVCI